jgi:hypothetical protein
MYDIICCHRTISTHQPCSIQIGSLVSGIKHVRSCCAVPVAMQYVRRDTSRKKKFSWFPDSPNFVSWSQEKLPASLCSQIVLACPKDVITGCLELDEMSWNYAVQRPYFTCVNSNLFWTNIKLFLKILDFHVHTTCRCISDFPLLIPNQRNKGIWFSHNSYSKIIYRQAWNFVWWTISILHS